MVGGGFRPPGVGGFRWPDPLGIANTFRPPRRLHFVADVPPDIAASGLLSIPVDPALAEAAIGLGHTYIVVGLDPTETQILAYGGSSKTILARLRDSGHPTAAFLKAKTTAIWTSRVSGNLNIAESGRGTALSASREALGAAEEPLNREIKEIINQINSGKEPPPGRSPVTEEARKYMLDLRDALKAKGVSGASIADSLNKIPAAKDPVKFAARHNVEIGDNFVQLKKPGEEFSFKLFSRVLTIVNIIGLISQMRDFNMARQGLVEESVSWPCEDQFGLFFFYERYGGLFHANTYFKVYLSGSQRGRAVPSNKSEVEAYRDEAKNLLGYVDFMGNFVPGLWLPEPLPAGPITNRA
jgi:hypothetical protein